MRKYDRQYYIEITHARSKGAEKSGQDNCNIRIYEGGDNEICLLYTSDAADE